MRWYNGVQECLSEKLTEPLPLPPLSHKPESLLLLHTVEKYMNFQVRSETTYISVAMIYSGCKRQSGHSRHTWILLNILDQKHVSLFTLSTQKTAYWLVYKTVIWGFLWQRERECPIGWGSGWGCHTPCRKQLLYKTCHRSSRRELSKWMVDFVLQSRFDV